MKRMIIYAIASLFFMLYIIGCAPKYGCPASGKSLGAEKILSGEKTPKTKSFKN